MKEALYDSEATLHNAHDNYKHDMRGYIETQLDEVRQTNKIDTYHVARFNADDPISKDHMDDVLKTLSKITKQVGIVYNKNSP